MMEKPGGEIWATVSDCQAECSSTVCEGEISFRAASSCFSSDRRRYWGKRVARAAMSGPVPFHWRASRLQLSSPPMMLHQFIDD
jgi:hypothetical protein